MLNLGFADLPEIIGLHISSGGLWTVGTGTEHICSTAVVEGEFEGLGHSSDVGGIGHSHIGSLPSMKVTL